MTQKEVTVVFLVYDTRERGPEPFIENEFNDMQIFKKQIPVADYHICKKSGNEPPKVVAAFERKTYEDYAASFKDGRYENLAKLLALRDKTGCLLFFIIEGPAFPSPNRRFSRIPYSNILASITKLMVRHGIMIVQTEDVAHTAKRIHDIAVAISMENAYQFPIKVLPEAGDALTGGDDKGRRPSSERVRRPSSIDISIPTEITEKIEEAVDTAALKMWTRLRGVSVVLGGVLTRSFSVMDLVKHTVSVDTINSLKTGTGRIINKDARNSLLAVRSSQSEQCRKILSGIRGISPAMAEHLIKSANGFARLCSYSVGALAIMKIVQKNRTTKLGDTRAKRIMDTLNFVVGVRGVRGETAAVAGVRAGAAAAEEEIPPRKKPQSAERRIPSSATGPKFRTTVSDEVMDEFFAEL
jgi:ERCC4-type nuclease